MSWEHKAAGSNPAALTNRGAAQIDVEIGTGVKSCAGFDAEAPPSSHLKLPLDNDSLWLLASPPDGYQDRKEMWLLGRSWELGLHLFSQETRWEETV